MNPVVRNALVILAKLHDWRGETFPVDGRTLLDATQLTVTEINDAVANLKQQGAVETIEYIGTHPYTLGEVNITSQGEYLYQERAGSASPQPPTQTQASSTACEYDCFISHASEDKERFVGALASGLRDAGCSVWYDDFVLEVPGGSSGEVPGSSGDIIKDS